MRVSPALDPTFDAFMVAPTFSMVRVVKTVRFKCPNEKTAYLLGRAIWHS